MKMLFIHPFGIGDVIFSLAAVEALRRKGHTVDYLCNERTEDLLKLCPAVRATHRFDRSAIRADLKAGRWGRVFAAYRALAGRLRAEKYDAALDFSMGREYAFLAKWAGIRRRIGWDYKRRGFWLTDRVPVAGFDDRSPRDYAMDLARIADPSSANSKPEYPRLDLRRMPAPAGNAPWIVVAPGGGESWGRDAYYKQWPAESWAELISVLIRETRASVAVLGSLAEAPLVEAVCSGASGPSGRVVPVVDAPFDRVIGYLSAARVFVGTDGGLLHLANLAGTPSVGIYGPVSERGYAPLETAAPTHVLTADVPCRPCYRAFRFTGCAFKKRCLTEIRPDRVAAEIRSLLTAESL